MTVYSYAQLEQLWINAGGPRDQAAMAAAIAEAESSGNSDAMNYTDNGGTQTSVGLWQVSSGTHSFPASWRTPSGNAAEAVAKYNGAHGWSPWGTYSSGAYRRFLSGSVTPDTNVGGGGAVDASAGTGASDPNCLIGFNASQKILGIGPSENWCFFKRSWARALLGGVLIGTGGLVGVVGVVALLSATTGVNPPGVTGKAAKGAAAKLPGTPSPAPSPSPAPPAPAPAPTPKPANVGGLSDAQIGFLKARAKLSASEGSGALTLSQALKTVGMAAT